jgi:hypothetical protein
VITDVSDAGGWDDHGSLTRSPRQKRAKSAEMSAKVVGCPQRE